MTRRRRLPASGSGRPPEPPRRRTTSPAAGSGWAACPRSSPSWSSWRSRSAPGTTALALKIKEQNATEEASKQAAIAASRAAQKLSSYDYQTLDADLKAASATTTGKLHTQYDKLAQQLRTVAVQQQAVSNTTVIKTGVVSATPDKVVALVYANRSSATKDDKQQRLPEPLRIKMTMVKEDGAWLASELTVLS